MGWTHFLSCLVHMVLGWGCPIEGIFWPDADLACPSKSEKLGQLRCVEEPDARWSQMGLSKSEKPDARRSSADGLVGVEGAAPTRLPGVEGATSQGRREGRWQPRGRGQLREGTGSVRME